MGPGKGVVKNVERCRFRFLVVHNLKVDSVRWVVSSFNSVIKILYVIVWCFTCESSSYIFRKCLDTIVWLDVPFNVMEGAVFLAQFVRVDSKCINVADLDIMLI